MKVITISAIFFCILLWPFISFAGSENLEPYNFTAVQQEVNKIAQTDLQTVSLAQIEILMAPVKAYIDQGKQCASMNQQELEQVDNALATLG